MTALWQQPGATTRRSPLGLAWLAIASAFLANVLPAQTPLFSSDAIAYYPFTGSAQNQLSSSYALSVTGATLASDRLGSANSAYRFDGVDDYMVTSQALPDTDELTIAAWIRPESDSSRAIFYDAQLFTPGEDTILRVQSGGSLYGIADKGPSTSSTVTVAGVITLNTWQHVAMTVRSNLIALYVNGTLVGSTSTGGNNVGYHSSMYVGGENHGFAVQSFFHGSIDDLVVYRRALSASEVSALAASLTVPTISVQPSAQTAISGQMVTMSVQATGSAPISYQWRKDGLAIPGATASTLVLSSAQPVNVGAYTVVVTNGAGSVTSSTALLTLQGVPTSLWQGLAAYYPFNGTAEDTSGFGKNGTTNGTILTGDRFGRENGAYSFDGNDDWIAASSPITDVTNTFTISLWVNASIPHRAERFANFALYPSHGQTTWSDSSVGVGISAGTDRIAIWEHTHDYKPVVLNYVAALVGWHHVVLVYSDRRPLLYVDGVLVAQGNQSPRSPVRPSTGVSLSSRNQEGGLGGGREVGGDSYFFAGKLDEMRVYNRALSGSDVAQLYASEAPSGPTPTITSQPAPQLLGVGQTANFSVSATGASSLTYQWRKDGLAIAGATASTLSVPNVQPASVGDYSVTVTSGTQVATSSTASLGIQGVAPGIWRGLIGYYSFSGSVTDASTSRSNFLTQPSFSSDRFGSSQSAAVFNTIAPISTGNVTLGATGMTVSLWLKLNTAPRSGGERVLMHGSWNTGAGLFSVAVWGDGRCAMNVVDSTGNAGRIVQSLPGTLTTNTWYHLTFAADGTSLTFRINGTLVSSTTTTLSTKTAPLILGGDTSYEFISGVVDDVRVYNRALSVTEQQQLYASEASATAALPPTISSQPANRTVTAGSGTTLTVAATTGSGSPTLQWQRNGTDVAGGTSASLVLSNVEPANSGLYAVVATGAATSTTSDPAIVGVATTSKVIGVGAELQADILHANGNTFDQVLLTGASEAITSDYALGQITRTSFIDLTDDIVQVEFSGPGTLSLVLDGPTGPALPLNYNQSIPYVKGHAGIVIVGATKDTNVSVFSVGRLTAVNSALFKDTVSYDGIADIAFIAIASTDGEFGAVRTANVNYFATKGLTGLYAPGVVFNGPVYLGDITATDAASPTIILGGARGETWVTGGDLLQINGQRVRTSGLTRLKFMGGVDSHNRPLTAKTNRAILFQDGRDMTNELVLNPTQ